MDEKVILGDFIYQLHKKEPFYRDESGWAEPFACFSASTKETIAQKAPRFISDLKEQRILREPIDDLICILGDWANIETCEGIMFTTKAMYMNSPKNEYKKFRIRYDDIKEMTLFKNLNKLSIIDYDDRYYRVTTKYWNAYTIKMFLEFASKHYKYESEDKKIVNSIKLPHADNVKASEIISGTVYSNISNASTIAGEEKFHASRGHGFAAERANTLYDKYTGKDAKILGDDNAKNGADRLVDGVQIQSKYCKTGGKCISECFEDGKFRYYNPDGSPMQIEVPHDMYDSAITAMENRIKKGEVPGVTDPKEASNIVRQGKFTYEQAKNIAKAGTIESLTYDAANGMVIFSSTFGLTTALSFATSIWNGESFDYAIMNAATDGLKVGGVSFVTAVLSGQLTKMGLNTMMLGSSEAVIKVLGPKGSAYLANAFRQGKNIYGATAMKSAAKMVRTNAITGVASVIILSSVDVVNIFRGRISGTQLFKNVANTAASVAGGTAGWIGGAAAGAAAGSFLPGIGNAIGGFIGGILGAMGGGAVAGEISDTVLSGFIEDDAKEMVRIIEDRFVALVTDYLLTQREVEHVTDRLSETLQGSHLKDMYASSNRNQFADDIIVPIIERELKKRQKIEAISQEKIQYGLKLVLEEMAQNESGQPSTV